MTAVPAAAPDVVVLVDVETLPVVVFVEAVVDEPFVEPFVEPFADVVLGWVVDVFDFVVVEVCPP